MAKTSTHESLTYTVPSFCRSVGISVRTFYALQERGEGPKVTRIGRRTLIRRETAEEWLKAKEVADPC